MRAALCIALVAATACASSSPPPAAPSWPVVYSTPRLTDSGYFGAFQLERGQAWLGGGCTGDVQSVEVFVADRFVRVVDAHLTRQHNVGRAGGIYFDLSGPNQFEVGTKILGDVSCRFEVRQRS